MAAEFRVDPTGRINQANIVENVLSPKLRDLSLHLKAILPGLVKEEEISEVSAAADKGRRHPGDDR